MPPPTTLLLHLPNDPSPLGCGFLRVRSFFSGSWQCYTRPSRRGSRRQRSIITYTRAPAWCEAREPRRAAGRIAERRSPPVGPKVYDRAVCPFCCATRYGRRRTTGATVCRVAQWRPDGRFLDEAVEWIETRMALAPPVAIDARRLDAVAHRGLSNTRSVALVVTRRFFFGRCGWSREKVGGVGGRGGGESKVRKPRFCEEAHGLRRAYAKTTASPVPMHPSSTTRAQIPARPFRASVMPGSVRRSM
jgi:hypothetical protein